MNLFSKSAIGMFTLLASNAFASVGKVEVTQAVGQENRSVITITGDAARTISRQLTENGAPLKRYRLSSELSQSGEGISCVDEQEGGLFYCYITVTGTQVDQ